MGKGDHVPGPDHPVQVVLVQRYAMECPVCGDWNERDEPPERPFWCDCGAKLVPVKSPS